MRTWIWILLGVAAAAGAFLLVSGSRDDTPPPDPGPLVLGHDTTRIVEPLDADGNVDYIAALNAGAHPPAEDNAAIALIRILGTTSLTGDVPAVLAQLGAPEDLPEQGLFVPGEEEVIDSLFDHVLDMTFEGMPPIDYPKLRAWHARDTHALDTLREAATNPHLWLPIVRSEDRLQRSLRAIALGDLLTAQLLRAELHRVDGDWPAAMRAVAVVLQIVQLGDTSVGMLERMVFARHRGLALDWMAWLLRTQRPSEAMCRDMIALISAMPAHREMASDVDRFDRFCLLEAALREAGQLRGALHPMLGPRTN